jgi:hypothetical protein
VKRKLINRIALLLMFLGMSGFGLLIMAAINYFGD